MVVDPTQLNPALFTAPYTGPNPFGLFGPRSYGNVVLPPLYRPPQLTVPPPNNPAGSVLVPPPINTAQFQTAQQPPSEDDFLAQVRQVGSNVLGAAVNAFDLPAQYIARPAFEILTEPQVAGETISKGEDFFKTINLLNEDFERNQAPGVAKFIGEAALNPLTYVSAGSLSALRGAKYIKPLVEAVPGAAGILDASIGGLRRYEQAVDFGFRTGSNLVSGLAQNYIPLGVAKANARSVLTRFLPDGLVDNVLNAVPDEYTGVNVSALVGPINRKFPTLGLPEILKVPEVRIVKNASAAMAAWDAARNSAIAHGLTADASKDQIAFWLTNVYRRPQGVFDSPEAGAHYVVADILKRPNPINRTDIRALNRSVLGDNTSPTIDHALALNKLVEEYRDAPTLTRADEDTAIKGIGQLLGANFNKNPDTYDVISRWLRGHSDESVALIDKLSDLKLPQVFDALAGRARNISDRLFTMQVQTERANQTLVNTFLDRFDDEYTRVWKDGIQKFITFPISKMYLEFPGYIIQNATESIVRHWLGGGGLYWPVNQEAFRLGNFGVPNAPRALFEGGGAVSLESQLQSRFASAGPLGELAKPGAPILGKGNEIELSVRRSMWNKVLDRQMDETAKAMGLPFRTDLSDWFEAVRPPETSVVPELKGLSQKLVDDLTSMGVKSVPRGENAVNAAINSIDSGMFNRQKVAAIIDRREFTNLAPQTRLLWVNQTLYGEATPAAFSQTIDQMIAAEKRVIEMSPDAVAEKFQGMSNHLADRMAAAIVRPADLSNAIGQVKELRNQFTQIPQVMRDLEQEAIEKAQRDGTYRQAIHNSFNDRIGNALNAVSKTQDTMFTTLQAKADALGYGPQIKKMIDAMRQDNTLLTQTWLADDAFRTDFFKGLRRSQRQLSSTWEDYYNGRKIIWDGYQGQKATIDSRLIESELELKSAIQQQKVVTPPAPTQLAQTLDPRFEPNERALRITKGNRERAINIMRFRAANEESPTIGQMNLQVGQTVWAKLPDGSWGPHTVLGDITHNKLVPENQRVDIKSHLADSPTQSVPTADIRLAENQPSFRETWEQNNPTMINQFHPDPTINAQAQNIEESITRGEAENTNPDIILQEITDRNAAIQSAANAGQEPIAGGIGGGSANIGPTANEPIGGTNIGASATATTPEYSDTILGRLDATNTLRPQLENLIKGAMDNPAMTPQQAEYLKNHIRRMSQVFEGLDQSGKKVLNDLLRTASTRTREIYDQTFTNYDAQTAFDFLMKQIFPFWVYESRRWPYLAREGLKSPRLAAMYGNYMDKTDQGYIPVGELPVQINPLRGTILGGITRATSRDFPLKETQGLNGALESIEQTLGKFGFYLGPQFSIPSQLLRGEAGQTLPSILSTGLDLGRAIDAPGTAAFQNVLPDQFRDYYVRQILASQGHEPDKIYTKALSDPNGIEAQTLDEAQRQGSLVQAILAQTGVLRFRTPEYTQYQETRTRAIQEFTGINIQEQQRLRDLGVNLRQITALTPTQRQQLAAIPGSKEFAQITEPLLSPAARILRNQQREFFDTVKAERERLNQEQILDDRRMETGIISGLEWHKRFQDRNSKLAELVQNLKKSPAYQNVPISAEEQQLARQRFNLPAFVDSPIDIVLNEYHNVQPEIDEVTGEANWAKFFDDRAAVLAKYPPELQALVQVELSKNDTPAVREFKQAMELLRPYFGIKDDILAANPQLKQVADTIKFLSNRPETAAQAAAYRESSMEFKLLNRLVSEYQRMARIQFPQLDAALVKYYGNTPESYQLLKQAVSSKPNPFGLFR